MKTTIDKAGRVVAPAPLREKLGLDPGTELEVTVEDFAIKLARSVPAPTLERVGGRLVVRPTVAREGLPAVDAAALVDQERDRWPL